MRRKTAEHEAELRTRTELAKVGAEAEGRIRQERQNHDLILEKVRLEAVEKRDTVLKAIKDGGKILSTGLASYMDDKDKLKNTAALLTAIAGGIYLTKTSISITGRFIEARLGKPSLVRETSRTTPTTALDSLVLEPTLRSRLERIALST